MPWVGVGLDTWWTCFFSVLILMNKISCDCNCQRLKPQNGSFAFNIVLMALSGHNIQHPLRRFTAGCKVAGMTIRIKKPEAVVLCNYTVDGSLWIRVNCCLKWRISGSRQWERGKRRVRQTGSPSVASAFVQVSELLCIQTKSDGAEKKHKPSHLFLIRLVSKITTNDCGEGR